MSIRQALEAASTASSCLLPNLRNMRPEISSSDIFTARADPQLGQNVASPGASKPQLSHLTIEQPQLVIFKY
jgi:hypothetical protein